MPARLLLFEHPACGLDLLDGDPEGGLALAPADLHALARELRAPPAADA
jgi:hypothetical protein